MILSREVACSRAFQPDGGEILVGRWMVYGVDFSFSGDFATALGHVTRVMWLL